MPHPPFPRQFEHIDMPRKVGTDIGVRIDERVANPRLGAQVDDRLDHLVVQRSLNRVHVRKVQFMEGEEPAMSLMQRIEPGALERYGIIIIEIVDADDGMTLRHQPVGDVHTDEAGCAGDKNRHAISLRSGVTLVSSEQTVDVKPPSVVSPECAMHRSFRLRLSLIFPI